MFFFCPNCGASAHIQAATCLICDYDLKHWKAENVIKNPIDAEFMLNYATRCVNCGTVFTNAYVFCPKCHTSKYGDNQVSDEQKLTLAEINLNFARDIAAAEQRRAARLAEINREISELIAAAHKRRANGFDKL